MKNREISIYKLNVETSEKGRVHSVNFDKCIDSMNFIRMMAFISVFSSHTMWTRCQATWGGWYLRF